MNTTARNWRIASIVPEGEFKAYVEGRLAKEDEVTTAGLVRIGLPHAHPHPTLPLGGYPPRGPRGPSWSRNPGPGSTSGASAAARRIAFPG